MTIRFLKDTLVTLSRFPPLSKGRYAGKEPVLFREGCEIEVVELVPDLFDPLYTHFDLPGGRSCSCPTASFHILED